MERFFVALAASIIIIGTVLVAVAIEIAK